MQQIGVNVLQYYPPRPSNLQHVLHTSVFSKQLSLTQIWVIMEYEPRQKADNYIHCKNNQTGGAMVWKCTASFSKIKNCKTVAALVQGWGPFWMHSSITHGTAMKINKSNRFSVQKKTALRHLKNINDKTVSLKRGIQSLDRKFPRNDYH